MWCDKSIIIIMKIVEHDNLTVYQRAPLRSGAVIENIDHRLIHLSILGAWDGKINGNPT